MLFRLFKLIVTVLLLFGCASTNKDNNIVNNNDPYMAGLADIVTTEINISKGTGRELNPLGAGGAYLAKGIYLFIIRPELTHEQQLTQDHHASTIWYAAAINNSIQYLIPGVPLLGLSIGLLSGYWLYHTQKPTTTTTNTTTTPRVGVD